MRNSLYLNRRLALKLLSGTVLSTFAFSSLSSRAFAASSNIVEGDLPKESYDLFMSVSSFSVNKHHTNPEVGASIYRAFVKTNPEFLSQLNELNQTIISNQPADVETLSAYLKKNGSPSQQKLLLDIIRAWYSGAVGDGYQAITCSFQQALMFQTVKDGIPIPTFVNNRPNWWADAPVPSLSFMPEF